MSDAKYKCECGAIYPDSATVETCRKIGHLTDRQLTHMGSRMLTDIYQTDFLTRLRDANQSRLGKYDHDTWGAMQWGCAFGGEAGELLNLLKKWDRQLPSDPDHETLLPMIMDEIADCFIYLDLMAAFFGPMVLQRIIATKFNRDSEKHGFKERL